MKKLIKNIREASADEESVDYLIPYMKMEHHAKGEELFKKGDLADKFYFVQNGVVELPELKKQLKKGAVFGELGLFMPKTVRSASAVCVEKCDIYSIHKDKVLELYYQNPKFGFFIARMLANYASDNVNKLLLLDAVVAENN